MSLPKNVAIDMENRDVVAHGKLKIDRTFYAFISNEVLAEQHEGFPTVEQFWNGYEEALAQLGQRNVELLWKRDRLQKQLDDWYSKPDVRKEASDAASSANWNKFATQEEEYLRSIGYLTDRVEVANVISSSNVDEEISSPGPQLVSPLTNPRFVLKGTNARWGSFVDACTRVGAFFRSSSPDAELVDTGKKEARSCAANAINSMLPSKGVINLSTTRARLVRDEQKREKIRVIFEDNGTFELDDPSLFVGYSGAIEVDQPSPTAGYTLLFRKNGLHIQVVFDPSAPPNDTDDSPSKADVIVESAPTTILDCEDSVAVVTGDEKIELYRNWLKLMLGTFTASVPAEKAGDPPVTHHLNPDYVFSPADETVPPGATTFSPITLKGRSLLLIRHTAQHVYTNIVLYDGRPTPEAFLDAFVTALISLYDIRNVNADKNPPRLRNSLVGCMYVIKPKLHGPEEVELVNNLFALVEDTLSLPRFSIKLGLMNEERRTSLNLSACIAAAKDRLFFINTGFLDRVADDIRSSFYLGPARPFQYYETSAMLDDYECANHAYGVYSGLRRHGQVGKGMWTKLDEMWLMMWEKKQDMSMGVKTMWVPAPNYATIVAGLYVINSAWKAVDKYTLDQAQDLVAPYFSIAKQLEREMYPSAEAAKRVTTGSGFILFPFFSDPDPKNKIYEVDVELEKNLKRILSYVTLWVNHGIGCAKIRDITGKNLMEDRATLRITAVHVANWIYHGVVTEKKVLDTLQRLAGTIEEEIATDHSGVSSSSLADRPVSSVPYQAAVDLIFKNFHQANGYTEHILYRKRLEAKALDTSCQNAANLLEGLDCEIKEIKESIYDTYPKNSCSVVAKLALRCHTAAGSLNFCSLTS